MNHHVYDQALIFPSGQRRDQYQVAGGRNRQELGNALNDRQDDNLFQKHAVDPC